MIGLSETLACVARVNVLVVHSLTVDVQVTPKVSLTSDLVLQLVACWQMSAVLDAGASRWSWNGLQQVSSAGETVKWHTTGIRESEGPG